MKTSNAGEILTELSMETWEENRPEKKLKPCCQNQITEQSNPRRLTARSESLLLPKKKKLLYGVNENPPWYTCLALGMQHFLLMVESTVSIPYLITPLMCMGQTDPNRGYIASTIIFVSGLATLLQTTFGVRLPIIQGGSVGFLGPVLAIISAQPCPSEEEFSALSPSEKEDLWKARMLHLQGGLCVAALIQIFIGATGLVGLLMRWITPLTLAPTISLIGLSLFKITVVKIASNWWISSWTVFLLILFSQYLSNIWVPSVSFSKGCKPTIGKTFVFRMFPVLLALMVSWFTCYLLTVFEALKENDPARTDLRLNIIHETPWFFLPYPGQFGMPSPTVAGVVGISVGIFSTIVESIGDYYACAKLAQAPPPPEHAMNRGIFFEGVGTFLAGWFGSGTGTTSFSQNVAAIGITSVGSRRVVQYAGLIMVGCGLLGKVGALFINIPEPIIGGIFVLVFSIITAVGISPMQYINLNSSRNLFILGFSLFMGLAIPEWAGKPENRNAIQTSIPILDQMILVLLQIPMFIGGFLGFVLDNTIPGTDEERGLIAWNNQNYSELSVSEQVDENEQTYGFQLPFKGTGSQKWTKYIPISPTFEGWSQLRFRKWSPKQSSSTP